jgi:hypothetical protein
MRNIEFIPCIYNDTARLKILNLVPAKFDEVHNIGLISLVFLMMIRLKYLALDSPK